MNLHCIWRRARSRSTGFFQCRLEEYPRWGDVGEDGMENTTTRPESCEVL